ncbi:MAG: sodium-dependent transporter [Pseudomonadota bacterium]
MAENSGTSRGSWGGKIGFVMAASGSAVGLGNLWKFPYITWHNNGGAFVLVYLVAVLAIGLPIMMAEILIGRHTQESPVPAFERLGGRAWSLVGWLGVLTGLVILGYYTVIAGWTITSFISCVQWSVSGYERPADGAFDQFVANGSLQLLLSFVFMALTAAVVLKGINKGIERATKILMPILLVIILYLVVMVLGLPERAQTFAFLFKPNFSELPATGILEAVGHAFFTLSLGMGAMITYGSYMDRRESIAKNAAMVVLLDTVIALCACVIMYTIIFSAADMEKTISGSTTVGMLFITIPRLLYTKIPFGATIAPLFYVMVGFAALSSTISLLEVLVSLLIDKLKIRRVKATLIGAGAAFVVSILSALSLGAVPFLTKLNLFGEGKNGVLNTLDHLAANWMLPVGGLFITVFVGWVLDKRILDAEIGMRREDGSPTLAYTLLRFFLRFTAPVAILAVIVAVILGKDFS